MGSPYFSILLVPVTVSVFVSVCVCVYVCVHAHLCRTLWCWQKSLQKVGRFALWFLKHLE